MVHKNLNRPETSLTPFDLLNKNRVYYNIKRQGIITVMIPCLCLFIALSSLFSELVGACLPQTLLGTSTANWKLYMSLQIYHIY